MASWTHSSSEEHFLCSICLEVFSEPVSTPCGHNFCKHCISQTWNTNVHCKCPMCNRSFSTRPELCVNTLLSEMVSHFKLENRRRPMDKPTDPTNVLCDMCSVPRVKALKSCLICLSSFCESHLQPHLNVSGLKKHQLMEPMDNLEEWMCPTHQRPLELFCGTDKKTICVECSVLEHQGHTFVSLKEAFEHEKASLQQTVAENQRLVEQRRMKVQEIQRCLKLSETENQREMAAGLQAFTALTQSVQSHREHFIEQLQEKQRNNQRQAQELLHQLQQEMCELEKSSAEAQQLSLSTDLLHFLQRCTAVPSAGLKEWSSISFAPQTCEGSAAHALFKLENSLSEKFKQLGSKLELRKVQHFAVDVTLDPDTAHNELVLSEDLKKVYCGDAKKKLPDFPQRFNYCHCVLGKQSFPSGSFYFEVQVKDKMSWTLGVALESIKRKGEISLTPQYRLWTIWLRKTQYMALDDRPVLLAPQRPLQKIGVFVDYGAGLVSFYDVDSADLLYSFTGCSFKGRLIPYFNPGTNKDGTNSLPMEIVDIIQ